jgi:hypothetical protein
VLLVAPFFAVSLAAAFARWKRAGGSPSLVHGVIAALFLVTTAYQATLQPGRVVTVADAAGGFYYGWTPAATDVAALLRREWRGGAILCATGSGQSHRIIQPSGIPTGMFTTGLDVDRRLLDVEAVRDEFAWIVIGLDPSADGRTVATTLLGAQEQLARTHEPIYRNEHYVVFRSAGIGDQGSRIRDQGSGSGDQGIRRSGIDD